MKREMGERKKLCQGKGDKRKGVKEKGCKGKGAKRKRDEWDKM